MTQSVDLPGAAHLVLADGVVHLDPDVAVFEAMLEGWARQQRTRFLAARTIGTRLTLVRRFAAFTNEYPWRWRPDDVEAFIDWLRPRRPGFAVSTARSYQLTLRLRRAQGRPRGTRPDVGGSHSRVAQPILAVATAPCTISIPVSPSPVPDRL